MHLLAHLSWKSEAHAAATKRTTTTGLEIILEIIRTEYAPNDYQTDAMFICK